MPEDVGRGDLARWRGNKHYLVRLSLLFATILCSPLSVAPAQGASRFTLDDENDYFDFWLPPDRRHDDNYTQGVHLSASFWQLPKWARRNLRSCGPPSSSEAGTRIEPCARGAISFGQELYTPTDEIQLPLKGERPYAAILLVDLAREKVTRNTSSTMSLRLGTTGPASLGEATQKAFHRLFSGFRKPVGWEHQMKSEPIFLVKYNYRRMILDEGWPIRVTVAPAGGVDAGNLAIGAQAGIEASLGYRTPHPWQSDSILSSGYRVYLTAGAQEEWVGYDLLLHGNTRETRHRVEPRPFVDQRYAALNLGFSRMTLEYRAVVRGQDYTTGPPRHPWGRITLTYVT